MAIFFIFCLIIIIAIIVHAKHTFVEPMRCTKCRRIMLREVIESENFFICINCGRTVKSTQK